MKTIRNCFTIGLALISLIGYGFTPLDVQGEELAPDLIMYKNPNCGCCSKWATHMKEAGFDVAQRSTYDMASIKTKSGIKPRYRSCHTMVDRNSGYVFEGHIPANTIQRFLKERPENALGLAVPGMPLGSPGMEIGERKQPYRVIQLNKDGSATHYEDIK